MTLITATQLASRTRCGRRASLGALGPSVAAATAFCHPQQQVRSFRFGRLWSSYFDPEFTRDSCRRQRHFRYKYAETLNRRLSWDQNSPAADATKPTSKRVLGNYWGSSTADNRNGAGFDSLDAAQKTPENPDGVRPGQNIEDAERAPLEDLLFGNGGQNHTHWSDKKQKGQKSKKHSRHTHPQKRDNFAQVEVEYVIDPITNRKVPRSANGRAHSVPDIGVEIPLESFKTYRSQFAAFAAPDDADTQAPIFYDGPPPESELKKYSQVKIDATPWDSASRTTAQVSSTLDGSPVTTPPGPEPSLLDAIAWKHQEVLWHHSDGIASRPKAWVFDPDTSKLKGIRIYTSTSEGAPVQEYQDLGKYGAVRYQEPDGKSPEQEAPQRYEDLQKYTAVRSHEPDGRYKAEADSAEKEYQDLGKYEAVMSHEPDGKYSAQEGSTIRDYNDLPKYGAVRSHEPDGKYRSEEAGATQQHGDLHKYDAVRSHEPDGKYKTPQNATGQQYEDLDQYGAIRSHEPDGRYKAEQDSTAQHYDDLHKYGPVKADEPDGKYKLQQDAPVQRYDDLHNYNAVRAHEPDGKYKAEAEAEASAASEVDPEELRKYTAFRSHEPDGMYAASDGKSFPDADPEELAKYTAFRSHEPDGKYAANYIKSTEDRIEEARYQAFRSHEPDGKYSPNQQVDPTAGYSDLDTYGAFRSHEPDGKYAKEHSKSTEHAEELDQYHAVRSHEPDGKYAAQSESCTEVPDLGNHEAFGYEDSETKVVPPGNEDVADQKGYKAIRCNEPSGQSELQPKEESYKSDDIGGDLQATREKPTEELMAHQTEFNGNIESQSTSQAASTLEPEKTEYRKLQELLMSEVTAEDSPGFPVDNKNDLPKSLNGNYARDFPQEFTKTWSSKTSDPNFPLLPIDLDATLSDAQESIHEISGSSARPPNVLEPALDRYLKPGKPLAGKPSALDPYSKEPQGLETSYVQECGEKVPVFATIYGAADLESQSSNPEVSTASALPNSDAPEPVLYKILVYDPTMQSVEVAETASIVPDTATPLTPADVLLRISNPSKFFPHFAPLQAQGYEIVSGGGDVLIFRKVRDAVPAPQDQPDSGPAVPASISSHPPVNPIDMTGDALRNYDVAASRFASPTGFVNYDLPPLNHEPNRPPPSHRFKSGIEVHREEPVFSGSKTKTKEKREKETKSLPKRLLVGAVWVGGLSYSLAVVGDYFKTGGADGKGTRGRL